MEFWQKISDRAKWRDISPDRYELTAYELDMIIDLYAAALVVYDRFDDRYKCTAHLGKKLNDIKHGKTR